MPITSTTILIISSFYGLVIITAFIVLGIEFAIKELKSVS